MAGWLDWRQAATQSTAGGGGAGVQLVENAPMMAIERNWRKGLGGAAAEEGRC